MAATELGEELGAALAETDALFGIAFFYVSGGFDSCGAATHAENGTSALYGFSDPIEFVYAVVEVGH